MFHPSKNQAINQALQQHASVFGVSPESVPLATYIQAELHRLNLSEQMEDQLRILDEVKGTWVDEDVIVCAMDAVRTLTGQQGYVPSERQQERLRSHGFRATDETLIPAKDVRRFARRFL